MVGFFARTRKAFVAAAVAAVSAFSVAIKDGDFSGTDLALVIGATAIAWVATFVTGNASPQLAASAATTESDEYASRLNHPTVSTYSTGSAAVVNLMYDSSQGRMRPSDEGEEGV